MKLCKWAWICNGNATLFHPELIYLMIKLPMSWSFIWLIAKVGLIFRISFLTNRSLSCLFHFGFLSAFALVIPIPLDLINRTLVCINGNLSLAETIFSFVTLLLLSHHVYIFVLQRSILYINKLRFYFRHGLLSVMSKKSFILLTQEVRPLVEYLIDKWRLLLVRTRVSSINLIH